MQSTNALRTGILLAGVAAAFLAGAAPTRAEGLGLRNNFRTHKPCCPPNGFFGYYPQQWRQWPVVSGEPAPATMTVLPPQTPPAEPAPLPMEVPPEKKTHSSDPGAISAPAIELPYLPTKRGPTFLKGPIIQR